MLFSHGLFIFRFHVRLQADPALNILRLAAGSLFDVRGEGLSGLPSSG